MSLQPFQSGFKKIFDSGSEIIISVNEDSVSFQEDLPNPNADKFSVSLAQYKDFIESKNLSISVEVNELKATLPIKISPHSIVYYHKNFGDSIIKVSAPSPSFDGYSIIATSNSTTVQCTESGSAQNVYLSVSAFGSGGAQCNNANKNIKMVNVTTSSGDPIIALEVINDDLTITASQSINIKTTLDALDDIGRIRVLFPDGIIYLNYTEFNIAQNTTVYIVQLSNKYNNSLIYVPPTNIFL